MAVPETFAKNAETGAGYKFTRGGAVGMFLSAVQVEGQTLYSFLPVSEGVAGGQAFNVGPDEACVLVIPKPAPAAPPAPPVAAVPPPPPAPAAAPPAPPAGPPPPPLLTRVTAPPPAPGVPAGPPAATPPTEKKARAKKAGDNASAPPGIRLFLGCAPAGLPYQTLDAYISTVVGELQTEFDVPDIRFAPNSDHPLAYERWVGALAASVREGLPAAGDYVVFRGGTRLTEVVVEALLPFCAPGNVIRAF